MSPANTAMSARLLIPSWCSGAATAPAPSRTVVVTFFLFSSLVYYSTIVYYLTTDDKRRSSRSVAYATTPQKSSSKGWRNGEHRPALPPHRALPPRSVRRGAREARPRQDHRHLARRGGRHQQSDVLPALSGYLRPCRSVRPRHRRGARGRHGLPRVLLRRSSEIRGLPCRGFRIQQARSDASWQERAYALLLGGIHRCHPCALA